MTELKIKIIVEKKKRNSNMKPNMVFLQNKSQ